MERELRLNEDWLPDFEVKTTKFIESVFGDVRADDVLRNSRRGCNDAAPVYLGRSAIEFAVYFTLQLETNDGFPLLFFLRTESNRSRVFTTYIWACVPRNFIGWRQRRRCRCYFPRKRKEMRMKTILSAGNDSIYFCDFQMMRFLDFLSDLIKYSEQFKLIKIELLRYFEIETA